MSDTERVRAQYERAPYPTPGPAALPSHWVNAVSPVLRPGARVLVAGCGTGGEVAALSAQIPDSAVVGVDLSPRSIALAQAAHPHLQFAVADLGADDLADQFGTFDLIVCHAVADYVPDPGALFRTLARALGPAGVLYLGTNTHEHPGRRIRAAFAALGLPTTGWTEHPTTRAGLRVVHGLLADDVQVRDLPSQPAHLLDADLFPAFAHGMGLDRWEAAAAPAGLHLADSLAAHFALPAVGDGDLPLLYGLDRPGIARLVEGLRRNAVLQLLFTASPAPTPPWTDPSLWTWRATLAPEVGALAPLAGDWMAPRFLGLASPGLPELRLQLTAWMLELYRQCDGRPLAEVRASMPTPAHDAHVVASLFRFWQAGLVRLTP